MGIERNGNICGSLVVLLPEQKCSRMKQTSLALSVPMHSSQVYFKYPSVRYLDQPGVRV